MSTVFIIYFTDNEKLRCLLHKVRTSFKETN